MKKLFALLTVLTLGVATQMSARHHKMLVEAPACPIKCEKQQMITVCAPAEPVVGYACPAGFEEIEGCD